MLMPAIALPYRFDPRSYQARVFDAFYYEGKRRLAHVWHRSAGKDKTLVNLQACEAYRVLGYYPYVWPEKTAGRRNFWEAIDDNGFRVIDHFPKELIYRKSDAEMMIIFHHPQRYGEPGSVFQVLGADRNLNVLVGSNARGVVFSEFSIMNPRAWELTRPILRVNGGWAAFCYTPRGRNHGYRLYHQNVANDDWFTDYRNVEMTVKDSVGESGGRVVTDDMIEADRREGMTDSDIDQEYYCSWDAPVPGAWYAQQFKRIDAEKRIMRVHHEPQFPVYTAWDLGFAEEMCIWFWQMVGREVRVINYYVNNFQDLDHYIRHVLQTGEMLGYTYGGHFGPPDIMVHSLSTGMTRWETAKNLGIVFKMVEKLSLEEGRNAVKQILPRCVFDSENCEHGLAGLRSYQRKYNRTLGEWSEEELHNWASHPADAFRYLAIASWAMTGREGQGIMPVAYGRDFDPYTRVAAVAAPGRDFDPFERY